MKLTYLSLDLSLEFSPDYITTLAVEERKLFRTLACEFIKATKGEDTQWTLSESNKLLDMKKDCYIISDFFDLDVNNKTLLTKLNQRLTSIATEDVGLLFEINQKIQELFMSLEGSLSLDVNYNNLITAQDIVKLGSFMICDDEFDDIGKVISFIEVVVDLIRPKLLVMLNLRKFMTNSELELFFETIICKKIPVFCIEGSDAEDISVVQELEVLYTLDKDLCVF